MRTGPKMADRATVGFDDPDVIASTCAALATEILLALRSS